jgi:signal transduction histidine kinase
VQLGFQAIQLGRAPIAGSVAAVVTRNVLGMATLVNRALVEVRLESGSAQRERVPLHQLIEDAELDGTLEAGLHGISLSVAPIDHRIDVSVDRQILAGAIANVLQNAIKFTPTGGRVSLEASVLGDCVEIRVEDACGGLPPGKVEELFGAFQQRGADRTGLGLGLFISRKGIEASGGSIRVRDVPGKGCVFTIDLPVLCAI